MRQDLKLGTAHDTGGRCGSWSSGRPNRKMQRPAPFPHALIRPSVISLTACKSDTCTDRGLHSPTHWVILHQLSSAHIVQSRRGEDRLTCQSCQGSLDQCQDDSSHSALRSVAGRRQPQTNILPRNSHATKWLASRSSVGCINNAACIFAPLS